MGLMGWLGDWLALGEGLAGVVGWVGVCVKGWCVCLGVGVGRGNASSKCFSKYFLEEFLETLPKNKTKIRTYLGKGRGKQSGCKEKVGETKWA